MKLGFLGYGNLAKSLLKGLRSRNAVEAGEIYICAKTAQTLEFAASQGYGTADNAADLFDRCDTVVLAVKPKVFREMKSEISGISTAGKRVVSVMADVHTDEIYEAVRCPVLRVMPTLASADAADIIGYSEESGFEDIADLLSKLGYAVPMSEDMLDRLTVAASCGLGFAAHILGEYKKTCMAFGFDEEQSTAITANMFGYAASVGRKSCNGFEQLEQRVSTKGGATEAGNNAMRDKLASALENAFDAAGEKAGIKKKQ